MKEPEFRIVYGLFQQPRGVGKLCYAKFGVYEKSGRVCGSAFEAVLFVQFKAVWGHVVKFLINASFTFSSTLLGLKSTNIQ